MAVNGYEYSQVLASWKQEEIRGVHWLERCCKEISTVLYASSDTAVAFVGNADLAPGLKNREVYRTLVQSMRQQLPR